MCAQSASPVGVDVPMSMSASLTLPSAESATEPGLQHSVRTPKIVGVGTAVAGESYSQRDLLEMFRITDSRIRSVFLNSAIERRYLSLPPAGADGVRADETQKDLLAKHKALALDMGARAIEASLANAGVQIDDIGHLCCVATTGFLTPGLSALLIHQMGIAPRCSRVDVVGMGCNAGLNALGVTAGWSAAHPDQLAVLLCAEACSAAYVFDSTMRTAVVNSLFGDGAAAIAVISGPGGSAELPGGGPRILSFASHIITGALDAMRYDWDSEQG